MIEHVWIDRNELEQLRKENDKLRQDKKDLSYHRDMFADGYANRSARVAELEQENERLEACNRELKGKQESTWTLAQRRAQWIFDTQGELSGRVARIKELEQENEQLKAENAKLEWAEQWSTDGHEKKNREISNLENALNNLRQTYRETNVARNTLAEKVMRLEQENETLKANLTAAEGEMRRLQNAVECWKSEWNRMRRYEG